MRRMFWAVAIIGALVVLDVVLANIPAPVPTTQAISNVEHSASFREIVGNGTYFYLGYTDNPPRYPQCPYSFGGEGVLRFIDPFHEYAATTLFFTSIAQRETILVRVNPSTGEIFSIQTEGLCL